MTQRVWLGVLKGKNITLIGDSTLRQYLESLADVMNLHIPQFDVGHEFNKSVDSAEYDIRLSWRKHEMLFQNNALFGQDDVMSNAFQIDTLANDGSVHGGDAKVFVHYGAHLQAFPPNVFRNRLRILARTLQN